MTLPTKLSLAFGSSLLITISLVVGTQWAARTIELDYSRLQLSAAQLQTIQTLIAKLAQFDAALTRNSVEPHKGTLEAAVVYGRRAEALALELVQKNREELGLLADRSRAAAEDLEDELEESRRLAELQGLLHEVNLGAADLARSTTTASSKSQVPKVLDLLHQLDDRGLYKVLDELEEEETEMVGRRERRLRAMLHDLTMFSSAAAVVAGAICVGAILLLNSSIRELHRSREREQAANVAKSAFLANMSHEIRTPLNGILGFTQLLMRKPELMQDQQAQQYLLTIHSSGQHLLNLISDILDLSKVEAGRLECHPSDVDVLNTFEEVVSILRVRAVAKSILLQFEWHGRVPTTIRTDAARLKQVLINLVGNAVKFTDVGGVRIDARVEKTADKWLLVAEISDTGVGIPPEQLSLIFEPFRQADSSLTKKFEGTGLGLSISKRLAKLLGGDIEVRSKVGEGSKFTLTIDAGEIDAAKMLDAPSTRLQNRHSANVKNEFTVSFAGRRILVVDDGKTNRDLIRIVLRGADAEVEEADNGLKAVKLAVTNRFDAILMDVQMPVMDGLTSAGRLRQQGFAGPIVALTAHAMEGDRQRCLDAGCSGYLSKPIDPDELLQEVARQLNVPIQPLMPATVAESPRENGTAVEALQCTLPADIPELHDIACEFIAVFQSRMDRIETLRREMNWDTIAEDAHFIKGAGGTAGFEALTDPASRLEQAARMADSDQVDAALATLRQLRASIPEEFLAPATLA